MTRSSSARRDVRARRVWLAALLGATAVAVALLWRARPPADPEARARARLERLRPAPASLNVVLITLDTVRADRLGCYGFAGAETPNLDALAGEGLLFEQVTATAPLTLPSHASLFTGLYPPHHGVRDNGAFVLAGTRTTLAERLQAAGYATGGFVGAWVLESRWGVAQGFDRYSDRFEVDQFQKRGDQVVADALAWLDSVRDRRFFAWVHLFDPHLPYDPPEPFRSRHPGAPYQGEIAYTDHLVGRLLARLREGGLLDRTLVVLTADHGESLGEHGESNHGFFVYDATAAVPLIVRTPWGLRGRSRTQASGVDLLPTLLDLAGLPPAPRAEIDGRSLLPAILDPRAELGHVAYTETYYPRYHFGWQELRALRDGAHKFVDAPQPELYALAADPGETRNLYPERQALAQGMRRALDGLVRAGAEGAVAPREVDPQTRERLAALGYVGSVTPVRPGASLPDPKDKVAIFGRINAAKEAAEAGRLEEAIAGMRHVVAEDPGIMDAQLTLGGWLLRTGSQKEAVAVLKRALALKPDDEAALVRLVSACLAAGDPAEAVAALKAFRVGLEANPGNPHGWYQLAMISLELGRQEDAESALRRAVEAGPQLAAAHNALGALALARGDLAEAEASVRRALALEADLPTARYNLARLLEVKGQAAEAEALYRAEVASNPGHGRARLNLARLLKARGDQAGYLAELRLAVEQAPRFGAAHFLLAHEELKAGRLDQAAGLARRGLEMDQTSELAPLGYYVLADVYNRQGLRQQAAAALARARRLEASQRRPGAGGP